VKKGFGPGSHAQATVPPILTDGREGIALGKTLTERIWSLFHEVIEGFTADRTENVILTGKAIRRRRIIEHLNPESSIDICPHLDTPTAA